MAREQRHCAFCHKQVWRDELVKYGIRHYAHAVCLFKDGGTEALKALPSVETGKLPVMLFQNLGVDVFKIHKAAQTREKRLPRRAQ